MNLVVIVIAAALLAGCSLLSPPQPQPTKEVLSSLPRAVPHGRHHAVSLVILQPETSPAYDTTRMAYTERPFQLGYFRDHEWAEPPGQMIHALLTEILEQTGLFRSVLTPPDVARGGYVLRTRILALVQDYTKSPPILRLALRAELLGPSGQSIAEREITIQEPMRAPSPYAGVVAANSAVAKGLSDVAQFVLEHVR